MGGFLLLYVILDISSITELYEEANTIRTRLKGDTMVNHALDCTVDRE